jgi:hypothetical protein
VYIDGFIGGGDWKISNFFRLSAAADKKFQAITGGGQKFSIFFSPLAAVAKKFVFLFHCWRRRLSFVGKNQRRRRLSHSAYTSIGNSIC